MDRVLSLLTFRSVVFHELSLRRRVALSHLPLSATMLFLFLFIVTLHAHDLSDPAFRLSMALTAVLTVASIAVPWDRLPYPSFLALPVLDFVPITLLREGIESTLVGVGLLAVFPVIWLAASGQIPRLAVPLGALLTLAMVWVPLLAPGAVVDVDTVTGPLLIPFMMLGIGLTVQVLDRSLERQRAELTAKDAELRWLLEQSARRERLLDTVLGTVDVGVLAIDAAGHDVLGNRRQREMHSVAVPPGRDDAAEAELLIFAEDGTTPVPAGDRPAARAVRGESFSGELLRVGTPPGQRVYSVSARVMRDQEGRHEGCVLSFHDVTDLVAALKAKEDFLAGISHELRTPLTSIRGYTELLTMEEELPAHVRAGLEVVERNADQLLLLVEDLLGTAGTVLQLEPVACDLVEVLRQSLAAAELSAAESSLRLRLEAPVRLRAVCDPLRIGQVVDNLVSNAVKYSPGGGLVTVRAARHGDVARVEVADRGTGMSPEDAEAVFGRFFRSRSARMSAVPGLGLGLAVAREIVEGHGGRIRCVSTPGEGTVFTVELPVAGPEGSGRPVPAVGGRLQGGVPPGER
ncbi:sensor histidine kinase [Kocuria sp. M1R5S2]|uniref:sensor histidine kinase n=1 Tax=Kocuria rhizosphaerae TaxID=3376285 RepID=UPI0037ABC3FB